MSESQTPAPNALDIITQLLAERAKARRRFFLPALLLALGLTMVWAYVSGPLSLSHVSSLSVASLGVALVLGTIVLPLVSLDAIVLSSGGRVLVLVATVVSLVVGSANIFDPSMDHALHSTCATGEVLGALIGLAVLTFSGAVFEPRRPAALLGIVVAAMVASSISMALMCPWTNLGHVLGSHLGAGLLIAAGFIFSARLLQARMGRSDSDAADTRGGA